MVVTTGSWRILKEERLPTMIGYEMKKVDEELGFDFPLDDVTVSQVQPFQFCILSNGHPQKLVVRIHVQNECWEEIDNRKVRDLDAPQPTRASFCIWVHEEEPDEKGETIFTSWLNRANDVWSFSFSRSHAVEYSLSLRKFQERGSEQHKNEIRRILSILYACAKRISTWDDGANSYPSAEYLMRILPEVVWPFFPQDFDWEADHLDRTSVLEFSYHPAPDMEDWRGVVPEDLCQPCNWQVDTLPWYRSAMG
jgi:hypothetical protein